MDYGNWRERYASAKANYDAEWDAQQRLIAQQRAYMNALHKMRMAALNGGYSMWDEYKRLDFLMRDATRAKLAYLEAANERLRELSVARTAAL